MTHLLKYINLFIGCLFFNSTLQGQPSLIWAEKITGAATVHNVASDSLGNVYIAGFFNGTIDCDPGPGTYYLTESPVYPLADIYVVKLNSAGNFLWAKRMGGNNWDRCWAMTVDRAGNVYTTGWFGATVDFDPGPGVFNLTAAGGDAFISKLDGQGNFDWAKQFIPKPGMGSYGSSIAVDLIGNVYITGHIEDTTDFDPGPGTYTLSCNGPDNIFIAKLDYSGGFQWAKVIHSHDVDASNSIAVDNLGNVVITGRFKDTVDFNPNSSVYNLISPNEQSVFVCKLNTNGHFLWAKRLGGFAATGNSICVDQKNNVYITGDFWGSSDFDPDASTYMLTSKGGGDIFIAKLNAHGHLIWAKDMGGADDEVGLGVAVDKSENVYTTGQLWQDTVDFDPGTGIYSLAPFGHDDIFFSKLNSRGEFVCAGSMGGGYRDVGVSICHSVDGAVYITGTSESNPADFDPGTNTYIMGCNGVYIAKLDPCDHAVNVEESEIVTNNSDVIFPNPSTGILQISNTENQKFKIRIYNTIGDLVLEPKLTNNTLDLTQIPKGLYFLELSTAEMKETKKIILE